VQKQPDCSFGCNLSCITDQLAFVAPFCQTVMLLMMGRDVQKSALEESAAGEQGQIRGSTGHYNTDQWSEPVHVLSGKDVCDS
jgi:hypothetical protein